MKSRFDQETSLARAALIKQHILEINPDSCVCCPFTIRPGQLCIFGKTCPEDWLVEVKEASLYDRVWKEKNDDNQ